MQLVSGNEENRLILFSNIHRCILPHIKLPAKDGKFVSFGYQSHERKASWVSHVFAEGRKNFVQLLIPVAMASRFTVHLSPFLARWKRLSIHPVRPDGNTGLSHLRSPGTFEVIDNDYPIYQARILRVSQRV